MMHRNPVLDHPGLNGMIQLEALINFGELERAVESFRPRAKWAKWAKWGKWAKCLSSN